MAKVLKPKLGEDPKEAQPLSYTKHYYIGSERVSAKTGTMDKLGYYPLHWVTSEMSHLNIAVQDSSASRFVKAADVVTIIHGLLNTLQPTLSYEDNYIDLYDATHDPEKMDIFYFHPDHLGSSSYITNMRGMVSQHMEYLPFGELLVDEHKNSYNSPFKYNGKEFDEETGNYFYGARYYDPKWSIFISVDPLAEQAPDWTPYRYGFNNPIRYTDPTGMWEDDFVFNEKGDFVRIDKNDQPDKIVIENSQTGARQNYWFADPVEDPKDIRDGVINKVEFVSKDKIKEMISSKGGFDSKNSSYWSFYKKSKGGQDFDYTYSTLISEFENIGMSLFLPEGDYMAHNFKNFGNFLWSATGYSLGFDYSTLQLGAHLNSLINSGTNGYKTQLDSKDDQESVIKGAYYTHKNNFRLNVK